MRVSELGPQIGLRLAARGPWLRDGRDRNVSRANVSYSGAGMRPPGWFTTNVYEEISWARSAVAVSSGATTASRPSVGLVAHVALGIHDPRRGRLCRRARRRGLWWWLLPRTDELRQERPAAAGGLFLRRLHYLVREFEEAQQRAKGLRVARRRAFADPLQPLRAVVEERVSLLFALPPVDLAARVEAVLL